MACDLDLEAEVGHTGRVVPAQGGVAALGRRAVTTVSDDAPAGRLFARRRRANVAGGRQHHHKVKVTPEEEGMLLRLAEAQRVTIPRLLVESTLGAATSETPTQRRDAIAELFRLHRLLAAISNNVNQMAKATNATGQVQDELEATLRAVRRTAERIDAAIDGLSLS
ncbi:MobC family plasmid mobilization relaxosome protein [Cellulomonas sp. 179-A 9B4 NHS]|uniref:MobC family plasmid mobilization relaxosome protein n=1 Tax=Cellulomonas sp. 179-A 9B4 NHS TaxID=3142379 RepID=UPI0039A2A384